MSKYKGMHLGNTFVHRNYARVTHEREPPEGETALPKGALTTDVSPSYNKPGSIMHWVAESEVVSPCTEPPLHLTPPPLPSSSSSTPERLYLRPNTPPPPPAPPTPYPRRSTWTMCCTSTLTCS